MGYRSLPVASRQSWRAFAHATGHSLASYFFMLPTTALADRQSWLLPDWRCAPMGGATSPSGTFTAAVRREDASHHGSDSGLRSSTDVGTASDSRHSERLEAQRATRGTASDSRHSATCALGAEQARRAVRAAHQFGAPRPDRSVCRNAHQLARRAGKSHRERSCLRNREGTDIPSHTLPISLA